MDNTWYDSDTNLDIADKNKDLDNTSDENVGVDNASETPKIRMWEPLRINTQDTADFR